jgi:fructosamine-3-kinase
MAVSEFEAMKKLYVVMPELIAEPLGFGEYKEEEGVSFFVCRYYELSGDIPDVSDFPALLADMHRRPAGVSETGEFGLDLVTYGGRNPHHFPVAKTWEQCFAGGLALTFNMEEETHGPDPELAELREGIMTKVIPRLLRPLETEGRTIKPVLVHGDIWDGNASVNVNTRQPVIFDPTPLYAHNECEYLKLGYDEW